MTAEISALPEMRYDWSLWPETFSLFTVRILSLKSCFSRLHVKRFDNTCPYLWHESLSIPTNFFCPYQTSEHRKFVIHLRENILLFA